MTDQDIIAYKNMLDRLKVDGDITTVLNNIKNLLQQKPEPEAACTIKSGGISKIVHCVNVPDTSQINLACEVLKLCFDKLCVGEAIKIYTSHIMYLIRHENLCARKLAIDEVNKVVAADITILPVPEYIDVFVAVAQLIYDVDIGITNKAALITCNLPLEAYPKVLEEIKIGLEYDVVHKCNAFEVITSISVKSSELFQISADQGFIDHMVSEMETDDFLYQMNILEFLSHLAVKPHGLNYLIKHEALQKVANLLADVDNNSFSRLVKPGYFKFFGSIAHHYPKEILENYPIVINSLFEVLQSGDQNLLPVTLDTLGFIGSTNEGKLCLAALGSKYIQAVDQIGDLIKNSPTSEIKIRALHAFANLICLEKDSDTNSKNPNYQRVNLMTREWFRSLSSEPSSMDRLFNLCKSPFPDIKLASFALLDSVCQYKWGEELLAGVPGFIEFLLDRNVSDNKKAKEARYNVIKRLSSSTAFDFNIITRLKNYVEEGPFYSETALQVALEENH